MATNSTDQDLHPLLAGRFSPRSFADRAIEDEELRKLLEAARWAPSCYNEQPWRFLVARRHQPAEFDKMLSCLIKFNRNWASDASLLLLAVTKSRFEKDGTNNAYAWYDLGQAVSQMTLQAGALGLGVHQMAGFNAEEARKVYGIPDDFTPATVVAVGQPESLNDLPTNVCERTQAKRARNPVNSFAFAGSWAQPF